MFSLVLVSIEKIYQTLKTVFHHISKLLKVRQKHSTTLFSVFGNIVKYCLPGLIYYIYANFPGFPESPRYVPNLAQVTRSLGNEGRCLKHIFNTYFGPFWAMLGDMWFVFAVELVKLNTHCFWESRRVKISTLLDCNKRESAISWVDLLFVNELITNLGVIFGGKNTRLPSVPNLPELCWG